MPPGPVGSIKILNGSREAKGIQRILLVLIHAGAFRLCENMTHMEAGSYYGLIEHGQVVRRAEVCVGGRGLISDEF